ncbi:hypothetical protein ACFSO7_08570 [Bacillus sp. CGMCC 1.16607]|uniref:hypothetical protein n=1 Tax=Bacillus sp. CGMCC 1.16607 TaxID=3351842 RepID=UPI003644BE1A
MDKQRTLFYGFIVGFVLQVLPIPNFFFWEDVIDNVSIIFDYAGFIFLGICGIPLIIDVFRSFKKVNN